MPFMPIEGSRSIYYEHHEGDSGTTLVLVHSWASSSRAWDTILPTLARAGISVVALDLRGCGNSSRDCRDMSIEALAGDVEALVRRLGLDSVILNGWSLGGAVVSLAALQLADVVQGLVLTAAATPRYTRLEDWPYGRTPGEVRERLKEIQKDRASNLYELARGHFHGPVPAVVVQWIWTMFMEASPTVDRSLESLAHHDLRQMVGEINCPTLILAGRYDVGVPIEAARKQAEIYSQARLHEFESGHLPFIECHEEYLERLVSFVGHVGVPSTTQANTTEAAPMSGGAG